MIRPKVDQDLDSLLKNQIQFTHTIDEYISFSNQLVTYLSIASADDHTSAVTTTPNNKSLVTTLHLICENNRFFHHWLNLERQLCQKKLDMLFISLSPVQQSNDPTKKNNTSTAASPTSTVAGSSSSSSSTQVNGLFNNNEKLIDEIWSCKYADVDVMKPSYCAETFVLIIKAITGTVLFLF